MADTICVPKAGFFLRYCGCLLLSATLISVSAWGEVYRWTDAQGKVHFADQPPDSTYEDYSVPPANTVNSELKVPPDFLQDEAKARKEKKQERAQQAALRKQAAQRCEQAKARAQYLQERPPNRILITGPDGQPARMTVDQWNAERAKAQAGITENCG